MESLFPLERARGYGSRFRPHGACEGPEQHRCVNHILRNSILPIIALAGVQLPAVFSGALVAESVFGWAGMGRLFLDGLTYRDYPVLMALLMITAFLVAIGNLIADIALSIADPRLRVDVVAAIERSGRRDRGIAPYRWPQRTSSAPHHA